MKLGLSAALLWMALWPGPQEPLAPEQLLAHGRVDDARGALAPRTASGSGDAGAFHLLCRAHYAVERWNEAAAACARAVALAPQRSDYHLWLGRATGERASRASVFSQFGLARRTRTHFERAVELDPANVAARLDLAEYYTEAPGIVGGGKDKALAQAEAIAARFPAAAHLIRARVAEKNRDYAAAEKELRARVSVTKERGPALVDLASFYRRRERTAEMVVTLKEAAAGKEPRSVLFQAADQLYRARQELPLAEQWLREYQDGRSSEDAPLFRAHYLLGSLLQLRGDQAGAAAAYQAALALAEDFKPAQEALRRLPR